MDQPRADARPHSRPADANGNQADEPAVSPSAAQLRESLQRPRLAEASLAERRQPADQQAETPASRAPAPDSTTGRVPDRRPQADAPAADRTGLPPRPASVADGARQRWAERLENIDNPPSSRDELRNRINDLEPGHPSSSWHEDGTRRDPAPRLSELERPRPPLTDAEYAEHRRELAEKLESARAAGLTTNRLYALGPDYQEWNLERAGSHKEILDEKWQEASAVPCERKAVIAGGLGGSGKSTVLEEYRSSNSSEYMKIDPDNLKEALAIRGLIPEVSEISPMEASDLSHEESSYLARQLARRALAEGKNIIWDITMSSVDSTDKRIGELRDAGYERVDGIFVEIPIETSVARAEARHRRGCDLLLDGKGLGGRYVPAEVIRAQADPDYGSVNRRAFELLKHKFDHWITYDNYVYGRRPVVIDRSDDSPQA